MPLPDTGADDRPGAEVLAALSASVGQRVSVRRAVPGGLADVVGELLSVAPDGLVVRRRDGTQVLVAASDLVAGKVVPPPRGRLRTASDVSDLTLERLAAHGWRPLEREDLGQWRLRAAGGFTGRANSVLPLGPPDRPVDEALAVVRDWYWARTLVPRFQVPLPLAADLDDVLRADGWSAYDPVLVMVADVTPALMLATDRVPGRDDLITTVADEPDQRWLATYRYRGAELPPGARTVLVNADRPLFFTTSTRDGTVLAVARAALTGPWAGVTAVDVVPSARRSGVGTLVMRDLLADVGRRGARHVYLQVAADNAPARALYDALAFVEHHRYHYRRWDA